MTEREIFNYILEVAKKSKDPKGVVGSCLVKNGKILFASASSDDGVHHAENLVIAKAKRKKFVIDKNIIIYATLEPCSYRTIRTRKDCVTAIIDAGIKRVIFAAKDPKYKKITKARFKAAGIDCRQTKYKDIAKKAVNLFNCTNKEFQITYK